MDISTAITSLIVTCIIGLVTLAVQKPLLAVKITTYLSGACGALIMVVFTGQFVASQYAYTALLDNVNVPLLTDSTYKLETELKKIQCPPDTTTSDSLISNLEIQAFMLKFNTYNSDFTTKYNLAMIDNLTNVWNKTKEKFNWIYHRLILLVFGNGVAMVVGMIVFNYNKSHPPKP